MSLVIWTIVMVAIAVVLGLFSRGVPRVLSVVAMAVALCSLLIHALFAPRLFELLGATGTSLILAVVSFSTDVVVLGLLIAAAAIAARPPTVAAASTGLR